MRLEPAVQAHLDLEEPMPDGLDVAGIREHVRRQVDRSFVAFGLLGPVVASVEDHRVPVEGGEVVVRLYRPFDAAVAGGGGDPGAGGVAGDVGAAGARRPVHVTAHGGGWTTGSIDDLVCDANARHLAAGAGVVVAAVEYRLAPESPFPTPVLDVIAVVRWVRAHAGRLGLGAGLSLGGNSAGANLVTAALVESPDLAPDGLVLEVPALDLTGGSAMAEMDVIGVHRDREALIRSRNLYLGDRADEMKGPLASPLFAPDVSWFPPTWILTGELDPLRAEGAAFARRLDDAGVPVHHRRYPGALHGSPLLTRSWPVARTWLDDSVQAVRTIHTTGRETS